MKTSHTILHQPAHLVHPSHIPSQPRSLPIQHCPFTHIHPVPNLQQPAYLVLGVLRSFGVFGVLLGVFVLALVVDLGVFGALSSDARSAFGVEGVVGAAPDLLGSIFRGEAAFLGDAKRRDLAASR